VAERVLLERAALPAGVWSLEERTDGTFVVTSALRAVGRDGGVVPYPGRFDFVHFGRNGGVIERRSALVPVELVTRVGSTDGVGVVWLTGGALVHWVETRTRTEANGETVASARILVSFVTAQVPKPVPPPPPQELVACERCSLRLDSAITAEGALLVYARTEVLGGASGLGGRSDGTLTFAAFGGDGRLRATGPLAWAENTTAFRLSPTKAGTLVVAGSRVARLGDDGVLQDGPYPLPAVGAGVVVAAAAPRERDMTVAWAAGAADGGAGPTGVGADIWVAHYTGLSLGLPRRATSAAGVRAVAFEEAQGFGVLTTDNKVSYASWLRPSGEKRGGDVRLGDDEGLHYLRFEGQRLLDVSSSAAGIVEREVQCDER
jgi:hypothetical protein